MRKKMKWYRIKGYIYRHWLEFKASIDRKIEIFFFPVVDVLVFGFLSSYVAGTDSARTGLAAAILAGIVFWTLLYNIQREIPFNLLDDVWSRNIFNLYSTPLRLSEIVAGTLLLSVIKAIITTSIIVLLTTVLFDLRLYTLGLTLAFYMSQLFIFGWAFGFFTSGIILRYGTRAQAMAWSMILVLYPVSGALYPLSVLPEPIAIIARIVPVSYIFEGVRNFFQSGQTLSLQPALIMLGLNAVYFVCAVAFYLKGYKKAKARGWFVHPT